MFYDERIERAKGRISRNAIIIAAAIAGGSGVLRAISVLRSVEEMPWWGAYLFIPEAVICLGGLITLLLGLCRGIGGEKDERWQTEQAQLYHAAATLLLRVTVGVEVILLPCSLVLGAPHGYYGIACDAILPVLLFVLGAYCVTAFRSQDIYFNYSILESSGYARGVTKRLGKAGLITLGCLGLSLAVCLMLSVYEQLPEASILKALLQLTVIYGIVALALGGLYALLSYLEWASFTRRRVVSPATMVSLLLAVAIYVMYALTVTLIDQLPLSQPSAVILVNWVSALEHPIRVMFVLFLTYFNFEFRRCEVDRWVHRACRAMVLVTAASVVAELAYSSVLSIVMSEIVANDGLLMRQVMAIFSGGVFFVEKIVNGCGFVAILLSLRRAGRVAKGHVVAPFVLAVLWGLEIFLFTQLDYLSLTIYDLAVTAALLLYVCIVLATVRWEENEDVGDS